LTYQLHVNVFLTNCVSIHRLKLLEMSRSPESWCVLLCHYTAMYTVVKHDSVLKELYRRVSRAESGGKHIQY